MRIFPAIWVAGSLYSTNFTELEFILHVVNDLLGCQNFATGSIDNVQRLLSICSSGTHGISDHYDIVSSTQGSVGGTQNTFIRPQTTNDNSVDALFLEFFIEIRLAIASEIPKHVKMSSIIAPSVSHLLRGGLDFFQRFQALVSREHVYGIFRCLGPQPTRPVPAIHGTVDAIVKGSGPDTPYHTHATSLMDVLVSDRPKGRRQRLQVLQNILCVGSVLFLTVVAQQSNPTRTRIQFPTRPKRQGQFVRRIVRRRLEVGHGLLVNVFPMRTRFRQGLCESHDFAVGIVNQRSVAEALDNCLFWLGGHSCCWFGCLLFVMLGL
mmetsp:Transcript_28076/g.52692  ORF Transcript_28076/g.52692 Transcript_28076/m.52692 type:complete len:322 (-) Transcript_28076:227-1192(-)